MGQSYVRDGIDLHSRCSSKELTLTIANERALFQKRMDRQRAYIIRSWVSDYSRYVVWARRTSYICPIEVLYKQACSDLNIEVADLVQAWPAK